jgi:hypothetical protein
MDVLCAHARVNDVFVALRAWRSQHDLQLFIASSKAAADEEVPDPISSTALRRQFKAAPVTQVSDNVVRVDPAAKVAKTRHHFHSRVYVGTVHASLKFLPNRNWYPGALFVFVLCFDRSRARLMRRHLAELHSDIRRSLQKFETLTKALSKIKGAPKVVNLADEEIAEAKSRKLPKIQSALAPNSVWETARDNSCPESRGIISELTLLDHLLQLPSEQLRKSSHRNTTVSHADLNQPVVQRAGQPPAGVSLFSSAAAAASLSAPGQQVAAGSPPRHVQFAAEDAGFERVHAIPPREEARVADLKSLASKVSPRTRAIKAAASAADGASFSIAAAVAKSPGSGGFASHGKRDDAEQVSRASVRSTKAVYGSVRFGTKEKVVQKPCAVVEGADRA